MGLARPVSDDDRTTEEGFGVYIHWPFCLSKCPYCDFNSHVREGIDHARWQRALLRELGHYAASIPARPVTSIYFGGGTPSLMQPHTLAVLIERVDNLWGLADRAEITLEANPTSIEQRSLPEFRAAGANRVSIGVQALDDRALAFLGRRHSAADALEAVRLAQRCFPAISFDLIYTRPGQERADWERELTLAVAQGIEHMSVYQLTIEEGTAFHAARRRGEFLTPDERTSIDLFDATQEILDAAGMPAYEISNHARPGQECRHNLTYWNYGDYVGVGPGAHGRVMVAGRRVATRQHRAPEAWLKAVEADGHATRSATELCADARLVELTMMGLRLRHGLPRSAFLRELGGEPEELFDPGRLAVLTESRLLILDSCGLRATASGLRRLDPLLAHLLA